MEVIITLFWSQIRLSVGLEDTQDLLDDLTQALQVNQLCERSILLYYFFTVYSFHNRSEVLKIYRKGKKNCILMIMIVL